MEIFYAAKWHQVVDAGAGEVYIAGQRLASIRKTPSLFGNFYFYLGVVRSLPFDLFFHLQQYHNCIYVDSIEV